MSYEWLKDYCLQKPGATGDYKEEWAAHRYLVGGKMFLMDGGDKEGKPIISLKLAPAHGALLRGQHPGLIIPGYYMNKEHWNSVYHDSGLPDELVRALIDESYELIFASLTKKTQKEILEGA